MTGAPTWLIPNSTLNNCFPSINFKIGSLPCSVHGDSAENQRNSVFPTTHGSLVQLDGSVSIKSMKGCWNNNTKGEIGPELSWPRQGVLRGVMNRFGENSKFVSPGERLRVGAGALVS